MDLKEFNKNYRYKYDDENHDREEHWTIMKPNDEGLYIGDCEDYSLTLQSKVDGFSDWELWHCRVNDIGHAYLRKGDMVIDNRYKEPITWEKFITDDHITNVYKYSWIRIKTEMFKTWLWDLWRKVF